MEIFQIMPCNINYTNDLCNNYDSNKNSDFNNIKNFDQNLFYDELFLPEGTLYKPNSFNLDIFTLKKMYDKTLNINVPFVGKLIVRAGVLPENKSFEWVIDKKLEARTLDKAQISIPLEKFKNGQLILEIYAVDDSLLFAAPQIAQKIDFRPENVLYKFLTPSMNLCPEQPLYVKFANADAWFSFEDGNVHLKPNSIADFLTYFNAYSVGKWRKYTNARNVWLYLEFEGKAYADLILQTEHGSFCAAMWKLEAEQKGTIGLPIPPEIMDGIIGLRIRAISSSTIYGGGYVAYDEDTRPVRLGIGITSFKREDAVRKSVERLAARIEADPYYRNKIDITVVDNGHTLKPEDIPAATLVPNRNLGGTGGFMRNLLHYQELGDYTHCLFMDDDASCEAGSIFRALSFLRHTRNANLAISGAMLSDNVKFLQWENGAWFDNICHPLKCNYDLRDSKILAKNEREVLNKKIYGAWWFFMFPIKDVKHYSFPFFVRGDDIEFSYLNDFKICTLNGVCSWQEDFKTKESPQTLYFDGRSHILHHLVVPHIVKNRLQAIKVMANFFHFFNNAGLYDRAKSILLAYNDFLDGPQFWLENMETDSIRKKISQSIGYEKKQPVILSDDIEVHEHYTETNKLRKIVRLVTLNGHLLPRFLLKDEPLYISALSLPNRERIFLRKKFIIYNPNTNQQWSLERDSIYYFANVLNFYKTAFKFFLRYNSLKKKYTEFFSTLSSNQFWKNEFKK